MPPPPPPEPPGPARHGPQPPAAGRLARLLPRSLAGWFAACWGLFLVAAIVAGATLVSLYREGTAERLRRAEAAIARGCDAMLEQYRFVTTGAPGLDWQSAATLRALTAANLLALRDLPNVEGGLWRMGQAGVGQGGVGQGVSQEGVSQEGVGQEGIGRGALAYAYPTYEGAEPKTDVPAAELARIREAAETAARRGLPVDRRFETRTQALLLHACPLPGPDLAAWTMTRVMLAGGPAYARAAAALGALTAVLVGSAGWLGWLLLGWSRRLRQIEAALGGSQAADLPRLEPTGQRDLDRIVRAMNAASHRVAEARAAAARAAARATEAERLAGLGRVAAGVAHEVRNPIAAMRLKAENALATGDPERMARALQVVLEQVARLDRLSRDLLGAGNGGRPLHRAAVPVAALVAGRAGFYREQAEAAGVALVATGDPAGVARLDADRLERALDNLILNALRATPPGGRIALSADRRDGGWVLAVADTGGGVPPALRPHLFEPFASGHADGTGLGLALVREAAEAHGGTVRALHRPDGTTIEILLPEEPTAAWPAS